MPITITKLKMWKDSGYTKGCVEVPPAGSKKLPAPDFSSAAGDTLRPRKGSTLTSLELPLSFTQVFDMSYLYIEASDGAGTVSLFGWIDNVSIIATSSDAVRIDWTVDWWRSFSGSVTWGIGRITRCPDASLRRPPDFTPRYYKFSEYAEVNDSFDEQWIIVVFQDSSGGNTINKVLIWPAGKRVLAGPPPLTVGQTPTLKDCYNGLLDDKLGIDPTSISGVWVSPVCPCDSVTKGTDSGGVYYDMSQAVAGAPITKSPYTVPWINQDKIRNHTTYILKITQTADDLTTYGLTDQYGSLVGTFPWQSYSDDSPGHLEVKIEIGSTSSYLIVRQQESKFYPLTGVKFSAAAGCMLKMPLPTIPVNSNAWSSYLYSGQRGYDIESAKINQDQKFVGNLLGVGGQAINGGVGGAIAKGGIGAVVGAGIGTGVSLASTFIQNETDTVFRDRLQDATDRMHINQSSQLLIPGEGMTWYNISRKPCIVKIEPDAVSKAQYESMITYNGYPVEEFGNVSTFISTGGALQITDLTITGDLPPQGKSAIKIMLESGVRIIENNPSGVVP